MSRLDGERIVLTGIAGGIGSLVAARLRAAGAKVIGVDRVASDLADDMLVADLGSFEGLRQIGNELAAREVDGLINLAGIQYFGPFADQSPDAIWAGYIINLVAPAMLTRALMPRFKTRGTGRIVNIGSVFGAIPFAHFVTYSSAKAGLKGFSDALRREYAGTDVSITHVAPRAVRTALNSSKVLAFADAHAPLPLVRRHYLHLGTQQWLRAGEAEGIAIKRLFYILRPAAVLRWMRLHPGLTPPMHFPTLIAECDPPAQVGAIVAELIARKAETRELGLAPMPAELSAFAEAEFTHAKAEEKGMTDSRSQAAADSFFPEMVDRFGPE